MSPPLDDDWSDIRPAEEQSALTMLGEDLDLTGYVRLAADKAEFDLRGKVTKEAREVLGAFQAKLVDHLVEDLRGAPMIGLLKYVLESRDTSASELLSLVRSLPQTLLDRMLSTSVGKTSSGIHLLLALEVHRRTRSERYDLEKLPSGALVITFYPNGQRMQANLHEMFDAPVQAQDQPRPRQDISRSRPFESGINGLMRSHPVVGEDRRPTADEDEVPGTTMATEWGGRLRERPLMRDDIMFDPTSDNDDDNTDRSLDPLSAKGRRCPRSTAPETSRSWSRETPTRS